jgi:hypothetical protein
MATTTGTRPDRDNPFAAEHSEHTLHGTGFHGSIVSASAEGVETPVASQKICVSCGADVAGKKRFKDSAGQYWCYDCGVKDSMQRHPEVGTECPDCHARFAPSDMMEYEGTQYCKPCGEKHVVAARREKARLARVEQEAREEAEHRKRMMIGTIVALVVVAALVAYAMFT